MKGNLWQVVVIALALALFLPAFLNGAFADSASRFNASENASVDYDTNYNVQQQDVYQYNDSVEVSQNGSDLDAGSDYVWNSDTGTVDWLENGTADENQTALVNYSYQQHSERTNVVAMILRTNAVWLGLLLFITALGALTVFGVGGGGF